MFCSKCGAQVPDGMKFCPACGAPQQPLQQQAPQQGYITPQQQAPQQGYIPPQQQAPRPQQPYGQPPKKGGKGPIIAIISVVAAFAIGVGGFFIWRAMNAGNSNNQASSVASSQSGSQVGQVAQSQAQSGVSVQGVIAAPSTQSNDDRITQVRTALVEFFQKDIETLEDATVDYENTYGGEFGAFTATTGKGGLVAAHYVDFDNDGDEELLVAQWKYNTGTGLGYNQVYVYDMINGKVQRVSCGRSAEYGNTDHVAQIGFKQAQDGGYIYYTNVFSITSHEGGFCDPTAVIYKYTNGRAQQVCDTSASLSAESTTEDYLDSLAKAKAYMPRVYETWAAIVNKNNAADVCGLDEAGKDKIPLFGKLSDFDPDIKILAINYLMRSRDGSAGYIGNKFKGYWDEISDVE